MQDVQRQQWFCWRSAEDGGMSAEWGGEAPWYEAQAIRDGSDQHQEQAEEV
jgi:hypothetical protein